eukprot:g7690.t1
MVKFNWKSARHILTYRYLIPGCAKVAHFSHRENYQREIVKCEKNGIIVTISKTNATMSSAGLTQRTCKWGRTATTSEQAKTIKALVERVAYCKTS